MLQVKDLCKTYTADGGKLVAAMQDVSFEVPRGQMFALLGPSGCGKTTTLRSIAGLETPDSGEILVEGSVVYSSKKRLNVASNKRGFGMVFQSYAIWPHMTVFDNAAFPLMVPGQRRKYSQQQVRDKVLRVLEVVALDGLETRPATQLSGGQQQRLALARAIVTEPDLLLLDEPLSNLDAKLRERMRFELKRLQQELGITTVYVTHDQSEALALAHQIAVMSAGRIVQIGGPREIYERPGNSFVAEFVGTTNFFPGEVLRANGRSDSYVVRTQLGEMQIDNCAPMSAGDRIVVSVRPEYVQLGAEGAHPNNWDAVVDTQIFLGFCQDVELKLNGALLQARVHPSLNLQAGARVRASIDPTGCAVCR
jgi:iron(III) transport system ATP-binding protein